MYRVFYRGVNSSRCGSMLLPWWCLVVFVVFDSIVPRQVRRSRFLVRLYEVGHALQRKEGEHVFLSSRRSIDL